MINQLYSRQIYETDRLIYGIDESKISSSYLAMGIMNINKWGVVKWQLLCFMPYNGRIRSSIINESLDYTIILCI